MTIHCKHCDGTQAARTSRTFGEKMQGVRAVFQCPDCGWRNRIYKVKNCWLCGTDLDRRKRETARDYVAAILLLWPYSCRRCAKRRYRWGKHAH